MKLTSKLGQWMLVLFCMSLGFSACEHRTLEDIEYSHYVRVYIDDKIPNVTTGFYNDQYAKPELKYPEIMRVMLCNPNSGEMASERYLLQKGQDERGLYFDGFVGAPSGDYDLLLYNFDTELTQIDNANNFQKIEAYTNPVSSSYYSKTALLMDSVDTSHVLYEPNHLFTADRRGVHISLNSKVDTLLTEKGDFFTAQSLVKTYFLQVRLRGAQWVKSAKAVISGMSSSVTLTDGKLSSESSSALLNRSEERSLLTSQLAMTSILATSNTITIIIIKIDFLFIIPPINLYYIFYLMQINITY